MALSRRFQVAAKQELREFEASDPAVLFQAGNMAYLPTQKPALTFDPEIINRGIVQGTLTPSQGIAGVKSGRYSVEMELLGTNAKPLSIWLQSCGFRESAVAKIKTVAGITDAAGTGQAVLRSGTKLYYGTPSGGTLPSDQYCTVVGDYYGTLDTIVWVTFAQKQGQKATGGSTPPVAGDTFSTHTTVASATAKFVVDTGGYIDAGGIAWYPMSTAVSLLTFASGADTITVGDILYGATSKATAQALTGGTTGASASFYVYKMNGTFASGETILNLTSSDIDIGALLGTSNFERQDAGATIGVGVGKDPVRECLSGCRSNVTITAQVGRPVTVRFEGQGIGSFGVGGTAPGDGVMVSGISFPAVLPPIFRGANLVLQKDGELANPPISPCIRNFTFQTNNTLAPRQCANAASGVLGYEITSRAPGGTFDPDIFPEAQFRLMDLFLNNYSGKLTFQVGGRTSADAYNRFWFMVPVAAITAVGDGDANGRATRSVTYACTTGSAGYTLNAIDKDIVIIQDTVPDQLG